jgi:hypothetical protein
MKQFGQCVIYNRACHTFVKGKILLLPFMPFSSASLPSPKKSLRSENFPQKFPSIINMVNGLRFVLMRCVSFGYQDLIELGTMRPKERKKDRFVFRSSTYLAPKQRAFFFTVTFLPGWYKTNVERVDTSKPTSY